VAKSFEEYIDKIKKLARDNSGLLDDPDDYTDSLEDAVDTYSEFKPLKKVESMSSTGVRVYALPSDFDIEFTTLQVEHPVDATADELLFLNSDTFEVYNDNGTHKLRFIATTYADPIPPDGDAFRLHYTARHSVPQSGTVTIPDSDFKAVCYEAASGICLKMSQRMAQNGDGAMAGAGASYGNRTDKLDTLSQTFHQRFLDKVSPSEDESAPVGSFGRFTSNEHNRRHVGLFPRNSSGFRDEE
jgi:hypothetical protein